jgi:pilus assembly protein Flp/PilA
MNNLVLSAICFAKSVSAVAKDRRGVTAMEYGLIAALIALVIITAITSVGTNLSTVFTTIATKLSAANTTAGG